MGIYNEETNQIDFRLKPKQMEFLKAKERWMLYCGGTGAGKSYALIVKLFLRACVPLAREGMARKTNADIENSFIKDWKALIPAHLYKQNKKEQTLIILDDNGNELGQVQYFGCDDSKRLGSRQLTGCAIEEALTMDSESWEKIDSLVRLPHPQGNQIYAVCNPGSPTHWLYDYFQIDRKTPPKKRYIRTVVQDSYLGENAEYVEAQAAKTGVDRKRLYEGTWCDASGCIFDGFSDENNVKEEGILGREVLFVDDGATAPFVCLRAFSDNYGRLHIAEEFYRKGIRSLDRKAEIIAGMMTPATEAIVVDLQANEVLEALWKNGLPAVPCKKGANSVAQGISRVQTLLEKGKSGEARLTVSPKCENVIREFKTWAYSDNGEPSRENNHALDAIRYGVVYLHLGMIKDKDWKQTEAEVAQGGEVEPVADWTDDYLWNKEYDLDIGI